MKFKMLVEVGATICPSIIVEVEAATELAAREKLEEYIQGDAFEEAICGQADIMDCIDRLGEAVGCAVSDDRYEVTVEADDVGPHIVLLNDAP